MAADDEVHQRVVANIRALSGAARISLTHVPDRAGVARSHFWKVLKGEASPTLEWLVKVAEALDVDIADLVAH